MTDYIKIMDLSVSVKMLLQHDRLLFAEAVDPKTGEIIKGPREAKDRRMTFKLIPTDNRLKCEFTGSLHYFHNQGLHNADDFTAADLLATLDELVKTYGINPFRSTLNIFEFGVNVELPFPVSQVLDNLISYKYRPFQQEPGDGFTYYQCQHQRYVVKLYDKGDQYGLHTNVLRVEVKAMKMKFLTNLKVKLNVLADLLTTANYGLLGAILVKTFTGILFDEPTIDPKQLSIRNRDSYFNGRNPKFWIQRDKELQRFDKKDPVQFRQYNADRERLRCDEKKFRALLRQYRQGPDWQHLTAVLIGQTWDRLTTVDEPLLAALAERRLAWASMEPATEQPKKSGKITGSVTSPQMRGTVGMRSENSGKITDSAEVPERGQIWQNNHLSIGLICQNYAQPVPALRTERGTVETTAVLTQEDKELKCMPSPASAPLQVREETSLSSGLKAKRHSSTTTAFKELSSNSSPHLTASALRQNPERLAELERGRRRYAKGSKEEAPDRAAHNLRNDETNPRNNLARRLRRLKQTPGLFPVEDVVRLTDEQRALLSPWQGTSWEVRLTV